MSNKDNIFIIAEDFGFGPISILAQLALKIKDDYIFFTNYSEEHNLFLKKNNISFRKVKNWQEFIRKKKVKKIIACQEPISAILAWKNGVECLYIDNFFWFWNFNKKRIKKLYKTLINSKNISNEAFLKLINKISNENPHDLYILVHFFTNHSVIQHFGQYVIKRVDELNKIKNKKYLFYGAIVANYHSKNILFKTNKKKKHLYIQLGGMKNPQMSAGYLRNYANFICKVLNELNSNKEFNVRLKLHKSLIHLKDKYKNIEIFTTMPASSHIEEIKKCDYLFLQPGINGIYEGVFFNKAIFLLPEINPSHSINIGYLLKSGFKCDGLFFKKKIKPNEKDFFDTNYLEKKFRPISKKIYKYILKKRIKAFLSSKEESVLKISKRYAIIEKLVNSFNGLEQLTNITKKIL